MDTQFGEYVKEKRLEKGINLRKLAEILDIVPAYMSDIEKGRRYPPDKEKIYKIAEALSLTEIETNKLFDLAALAKENTVSPDLPEYIMGNDTLRVALRKARDINADEDDWSKVIEMLEAKEKGDKNP
ncbi:helix-turn-helix domain-containing protein [Bacillus xiapuensis]|uniref:helix-turn-helix domain-containing protein n=1 Tax=Bacillus xiapuensis TaxID=2014075 RepID=UPI000C24793D|nr:helix-turn-helix transcriptional regulator [Bacillus xiapuensis]